MWGICRGMATGTLPSPGCLAHYDFLKEVYPGFWEGKKSQSWSINQEDIEMSSSHSSSYLDVFSVKGKNKNKNLIDK